MAVPNKQKKEEPTKLPSFSSSSSSSSTSTTTHHVSNRDKPNGTQNPNSPQHPNTLNQALSSPATHHKKSTKVDDKPTSCKNPNMPKKSSPTPTTVLRHSFSPAASTSSSRNLPPLTISNPNPNSNPVKYPNSNPSPNSNTVTRRQLEVVLRRLGGEGEDEEDDDVAAMLGGLDGAVDLDELSSLRHSVEDEGEEEDEMRAVFAFFDGDGDGRISAEELREALAALGDGAPCSVEDCRRMIAGVDSVGDGFVCFGDFARMMIDVQRSM